MSEKAIHLPGLNGLRALAALTVLWGHVFQKDFGDWGIEGMELPLLRFDGVTLFFVISGFLITFLLLNEMEKSGTVSIPKFYMRRVLRIWPFYYLFMVVTLLLKLGITRVFGITVSLVQIFLLLLGWAFGP